jgi:hypothetical protein
MALGSEYDTGSTDTLAAPHSRMGASTRLSNGCGTAAPGPAQQSQLRLVAIRELPPSTQTLRCRRNIATATT